MVHFIELSPDEQALIREKQKACKASKQKKKKSNKRIQRPQPTREQVSPYPRRISKEEYFGSLPYGILAHPALSADVASVDTVLELIRKKVKFGTSEGPLDASMFQCFTFVGTKEQHWNHEFHAKLAYEGFFTITLEEQENGVVQRVPLAELQPFYSVIQWDDFNNMSRVKRANKKLRKGFLQDGKHKYQFFHNKNIQEPATLLDNYQKYQSGQSWLTADYFKMLARGHQDQSLNFQMHIFELFDRATNKLIAGEVGFSVGTVYSSLSGYSDHDFPGAGIDQLVCLGKWLQAKGYAFWSLGHCYSPAMDYKMHMGHRIYPRKDFLDLLHQHRGSMRSTETSAIRFEDGEECDLNKLLEPNSS